MLFLAAEAFCLDLSILPRGRGSCQSSGRFLESICFLPKATGLPTNAVICEEVSAAMAPLWKFLWPVAVNLSLALAQLEAAEDTEIAGGADAAFEAAVVAVGEAEDNVAADAGAPPLEDVEPYDPWKCPQYTRWVDYRMWHGPSSGGIYNMSWSRPEPRCRTFNSSEVEAAIKDTKAAISDPDMKRLFENSYPNTLDTTIRWRGVSANDSEEELAFIITGDIDAM